MARQTFLLPGGAVASIMGSTISGDVRYGLELPNGVEVGITARADHEDFPELVGSTVVTISTEAQSEVNRQSDGEPRMCVILNDATLYDREEVGAPRTPVNDPTYRQHFTADDLTVIQAALDRYSDLVNDHPQDYETSDGGPDGVQRSIEHAYKRVSEVQS